MGHDLTFIVILSSYMSLNLLMLKVIACCFKLDM